ncbi:uncharacterized protein LOC106072354 isoform X3 [Biomphalaria glabrata]|uniref:Uncharacterized protein LOC106072354 isoform X3 n=1 Tax=Biomphalaria glabrata TaxID=6526 RepID=A0A9W2YUZ5_BIOGL|nr:uncharacterized protein LOC106072354 isoform X3 [Biomphalaria glabrata]
MKFTSDCRPTLFIVHLCLTLIVLVQGKYTDDKDWLSKVVNSLSLDETDRHSAGGIDASEVDAYMTPEHQNDPTEFPSEFLKPKRIGFGGLLCCNHPPTRPPSHKRDSLNDVYAVKSQLLASIFKDIVESSVNKENKFLKSYRLSSEEVRPWKTSYTLDDDETLFKRGVKGELRNQSTNSSQ